ncbi:MAG TPA: 30S ribosomal protein S1 [Actinomycetota bacterium]|nr:30S ribosomal protein S1 [Actinomycetota bacterium]
MSDETTAAPEAAESEAAPEASTEEVPAADTPATQPTPAPASPPTEPRPAANAASAPPPPADGKDYTPEELVRALEASFHDFGDGDIVEGDVVKIDRDEVLLDIGYKSEGVIPSKELSIRHDVDPNEVVKVGDHIEALVLQKEDKEGRLILSKKRAQYERAWGRIEEVMNSGQTIKGPVIEVVKGGLILDIGLRGFLPASLVDLRRVRDLHPFVGTELEAKIIELDRNRNNVVLSRRAFLEESQSEGRKKFLEALQKGERRKGTVSSIVNFGAFVDLGGVDGLVHVSELSWKHVDHPQEVVTVGQEVEVEVLDVDLERERVSLSLKATQEDPWKEFERTSKAGAIITGQVTKLVPFGAFVRVAQGIEGLVHISEISHEHVDTPESVLSVGDEVQVKVIDVEVNRRRVSLSMRQVSSPPAREPEIKAEPEARREPTPEMVSTIQIPDDILAAVAEADAARENDPASTTPAAGPPPEPPAVPEPDVEAREGTDAAVTQAIEEARTDETADAAATEVAADDAIVAEAEADDATTEAAAEIVEGAAEPAEEAGAEEVSLEAILEDLKRREGRSE